MKGDLAERVAGALGILLVTVALVVIWIARLGVPRDVYVSELGAQGMPTAPAFMIALLLIVAGGALVGFAGRAVRSRPPVLRVWRPAVSLWVACAFFLVASQVTCTAGCPLPVGATFTWQDLVHTTCAVLAFAAACWAMLQCSFAVGHPLLARVSLAASLAVAAVAGAGGILSLARWQTGLGGRLELVATTVAIGWTVAFGAFLVLRRRRPVVVGAP